MNANEFMRELERRDACSFAVRWAAGKTAQEAWESCERHDWMVWWVHAVLGPEKYFTMGSQECPCRFKTTTALRAAYPQIPLTADAILGSVATGLAPQPEP